MVPLIQPPQVKRESQDEKENCGILRSLCQHVTGIGAKRGFRGTSTQRCANATVFRLLHQDDKDEKDRDEDEDEGENSEEDAHVKGSGQQSGRPFVNRRFCGRTLRHH